jgi:hypothetical protein
VPRAVAERKVRARRLEQAHHEVVALLRRDVHRRLQQRVPSVHRRTNSDELPRSVAAIVE